MIYLNSYKHNHEQVFYIFWDAQAPFFPAQFHFD